MEVASRWCTRSISSRLFAERVQMRRCRLPISPKPDMRRRAAVMLRRTKVEANKTQPRKARHSTARTVERLPRLQLLLPRLQLLLQLWQPTHLHKELMPAHNDEEPHPIWRILSAEFAETNPNCSSVGSLTVGAASQYQALHHVFSCLFNFGNAQFHKEHMSAHTDE